MAGAMLAAAKHRIPVIVDGFICTVAALLAVKLCPRVSDVLLAGHRSQEPGHQVALCLLDKEPLLDLGMHSWAKGAERLWRSPLLKQPAA